KQPWNVEWVLLPHSSFEGDRARQDESQRILKRLSDDDYVVLLDETGKSYSSPELTSLIEQQFNYARNVTLVIGGAYGVDDRVQQRADSVWSLSRLVFPHQLVRLILIEQLYRTSQISGSHPYHHD